MLGEREMRKWMASVLGATGDVVRYVLACCSATAVSVAGAQGAAAGVADNNLLRNGQFEGAGVPLSACNRVAGQLPSSWADNSCWNNASNVVYAIDSASSRSGQALKVGLKSGLFQVVQAVDLPADWTMDSAVWLRSDSPMLVKVALRQSSPPYQEYGSRYLRTSKTWTRVAVKSFSHGLTDKVFRQSLFVIGSATPGTVWIDDASLTGSSSDLALPATEVTGQFFGTHAMHPENIKTAYSDLAAGSVRIWDSEGSQWRDVQPQRPAIGGKRQYQWRMLDERVTLSDERKADLLMVLGGYAPNWASAEGDSEPPVNWATAMGPCGPCANHPRRAEDWSAWVTDIVSRYGGRSLRSWEIWNEPYFAPDHAWCPDQSVCKSELGSGYRGTPEQLLQLQQQAAQAIRKADPSAKVVSSGVSYLHRDYLDYFLKIGGGISADVIGYHLYIDGPPELVMSHVLGIRAMMRDHGVGDKPLWSTETAIQRLEPKLDPAVQSASLFGLGAPSVDDLGPAYMARTLIIGWAAGLGRIYQYAWDDQHNWPSSPNRVRRGTNLVVDINESGLAYRWLAQWMPGKRMIALDRGGSAGIWRASFQDRQGRMAYAVWQPGKAARDAVKMTVPAAMNTVCDVLGQCKPLKGASTISVDFRPVYLMP
jgi:hypothetical protein